MSIGKASIEGKGNKCRVVATINKVKCVLYANVDMDKAKSYARGWNQWGQRKEVRRSRQLNH